MTRGLADQHFSLPSHAALKRIHCWGKQGCVSLVRGHRSCLALRAQVSRAPRSRPATSACQKFDWSAKLLLCLIKTATTRHGQSCPFRICGNMTGDCSPQLGNTGHSAPLHSGPIETAQCSGAHTRPKHREASLLPVIEEVKMSEGVRTPAAATETSGPGRLTALSAAAAAEAAALAVSLPLATFPLPPSTASAPAPADVQNRVLVVCVQYKEMDAAAMHAQLSCGLMQAL